MIEEQLITIRLSEWMAMNTENERLKAEVRRLERELAKVKVK